MVYKINIVKYLLNKLKIFESLLTRWIRKPFWLLITKKTVFAKLVLMNMSNNVLGYFFKW
jgi:hypothetical protein